MWQVVMAANLIVAGAYILIAGAILFPLAREGHLRTNPLGTATAAIFLTCALHHGSLGIHLLLPYFGMEVAEGLALRQALGNSHMFLDVISAAVGVYYWTLRRHYGPLMRGAKLFEDLKERQRQAMEINDNVVQGLYVARTALALDDLAMSEEALRSSLESARQIISDLLGDVHTESGLGPGDLRRDGPALIDSPGS